jgi:trk system potassium uptake protein TrkA
MMTLLKLRRGKYSLVEDKIPPGAPAIGVKIAELRLPPNCVIAAVIRQGEIVIPRGQLTFEEGDEVLAIVDAESADDLAQLLGHGAVPAR